MVVWLFSITNMLHDIAPRAPPPPPHGPPPTTTVLILAFLNGSSSTILGFVTVNYCELRQRPYSHTHTHPTAFGHMGVPTLQATHTARPPIARKPGAVCGLPRSRLDLV